MPTVRDLLAEHWEAITDLIVRNAAPEKREVTMRTMACYTVDHAVPLLATYARKYTTPEPSLDAEASAMISKLVAMFGIADSDKVQAEILPHIQAMLQLLG